MQNGETVVRFSIAKICGGEDMNRGHVGRIYAVSLRMVADPTLAEELTQEAFVKAWRKLASFRGGSAFGTWLHRLAVNVVLNLVLIPRWSFEGAAYATLVTEVLVAILMWRLVATRQAKARLEK